MKSNTAKIGGGGTVLLGAILVTLYWMASQIDENRYRPLIALMRELQQLTSNWNVELTYVKASPLADFDGLGKLEPEVHRLKSELREAVAQIPDLPERVSNDVHAYVSTIEAKQESVDRFRTGYAVVRNSRRFLPLARASVIQIAQENEAHDIARDVTSLMEELDTYLYHQPTIEAQQATSKSLKALLEESARYSQPIKEAVERLLAHSQVLLERQLPIQALFEEALADEVSVWTDELINDLERALSEAQARRGSYELAMAGTMIAWLGMWVVLAFRTQRQVSERVPTQVSAKGAGEGIGATPMALGLNELGEQAGPEATVLGLDDLVEQAGREETVFGLDDLVEQAGREETVFGLEELVARAGREDAVPAGLAEESRKQGDVFHEVMTRIVARSLATMAHRMRASMKVMEEFQEKMRNVQSGEGALTPDERSGFEEGIAAVTDVRRRLRSEATHLALLAKRLDEWVGRRDEGRYRMIDINECIRMEVAGAATDATVKIVSELKEVPNVFASKNEIGTMFAAVLDNARRAIEASDTKKGTIQIESSDSDGNVSVTILDNGIGIAPERLDKIFNPFYTTRKHAMGIGLTVTNILAKKYGGDVSVNSVSGEGTLVRVTLSSGTPAP